MYSNNTIWFCPNFPRICGRLLNMWICCVRINAIYKTKTKTNHVNKNFSFNIVKLLLIFHLLLTVKVTESVQFLIEFGTGMIAFHFTYRHNATDRKYSSWHTKLRNSILITDFQNEKTNMLFCVLSLLAWLPLIASYSICNIENKSNEKLLYTF